MELELGNGAVADLRSAPMYRHLGTLFSASGG